jgi:very-short-patch-repair endonuclease
MRVQPPSDRTDLAIAALADRQYGVVSRRQLAGLGIAARAIDRRIAAGRLFILHRGVYAVGHRAPRREARWLAAVLSCRQGAVLSHRSAAALWEIADDEAADPDVTVAAHRRAPGIVTHTSSLHAAEATAHRAIPVTSPARTLVDLARVVDDDALVRAVREAQFRRLFHIPSMQAALERRPSRVLRRMLVDIAPTQSILEDRLLGICDRHRIPRPLTQQPLVGRRVDFLWPGQRLVVETDGWEGHSTPTAFQRDRATSNALQLDGYAVLRFTHADITRRPRHVARQIRAALSACEGG